MCAPPLLSFALARTFLLRCITPPLDTTQMAVNPAVRLKVPFCKLGAERSDCAARFACVIVWRCPRQCCTEAAERQARPRSWRKVDVLEAESGTGRHQHGDTRRRAARRTGRTASAFATTTSQSQSRCCKRGTHADQHSSDAAATQTRAAYSLGPLLVLGRDADGLRVALEPGAEAHRLRARGSGELLRLHIGRHAPLTKRQDCRFSSLAARYLVRASACISQHTAHSTQHHTHRW